ncbi:hypothetical protein L9F63_008941, partial [Diploptera punctata]
TPAVVHLLLQQSLRLYYFINFKLCQYFTASAFNWSQIHNDSMFSHLHYLHISHDNNITSSCTLLKPQQTASVLKTLISQYAFKPLRPLFHLRNGSYELILYSFGDRREE